VVISKSKDQPYIENIVSILIGVRQIVYHDNGGEDEILQRQPNKRLGQTVYPVLG
jgi:hypothetical protein